MRVKWDPPMDQRLLLLIIAVANINWTLIAARWSEVYGQQNIPQPTKKAIIEHIAKLRKMVEGSHATSRKPSAGKSSTAPSFVSSTDRVNKKPFVSSSKPKAKGKGKQKAVDTETDDSENEQDARVDSLMKSEGDEDQKPLFGDVVDTRARPSLPRSARPNPGHFAAMLEGEGVLNDSYDSDADNADAEGHTTVQNTPTDTPMPDQPHMQATSTSFHTPASVMEYTPISTPTPAPRNDRDESDDECIVVRSVSRKCLKK